MHEDFQRILRCADRKSTILNLLGLYNHYSTNTEAYVL
jgi:hypothetical protein